MRLVAAGSATIFSMASSGDILPQLVLYCLQKFQILLSKPRLEELIHNDLQQFLAYVACLHQLYLFGIAVQLKRLGYHMTQI